MQLPLSLSVRSTMPLPFVNFLIFRISSTVLLPRSMLLTRKEKILLINSILIRERFLSGDARAVCSLFIEVETYSVESFLSDFKVCLHIPCRFLPEVRAVSEPEFSIQLTLF